MLLSLGALLLTSIACSKGGILTLERNPASFVLQSATDASFVSSSTQFESTTHNYKILQSVGDYLPEVEQTTTHNYKYFSGVQGQLVSDHPTF